MNFFNTITLLFVTLCVGVGTVAAQSAEQVLRQATESMIYGNADQLSNYFSQRVEITVDGRSKNYDRTQAQHVMSRFFQDHPPSLFKVFHTGKTGSTYFAVAEYKSSKGTFEVNIYIRLEDNRVTDLHFE